MNIKRFKINEENLDKARMVIVPVSCSDKIKWKTTDGKVFGSSFVALINQVRLNCSEV